MKVGIVGLPNVGKSTLFKALTKKQVDIANYPFCTIQPNTGIVKVPDKRLDFLARLNASEQVIPAAVEFVDIAGLVKGAHKGEGLGNQFLSHIREVDAIAHVVRAFVNDDITHIGGAPHPKEDIETIHTELALADLATVEKRLVALKNQMKSSASKESEKQLTILERVKETLNSGKLAHCADLAEEEAQSIRECNLLTLKPFIFILNVDESGASHPSLEEELKKATQGYETVTICAQLEAEMSELDSESVAELGLQSQGLDALIRTAYTALHLITYFTSGPKETRAWTIAQHTKAPQAAGEIHTDFEKGFIRAEVINWKDLIDVGGELHAKENGLIRLEGKEYVVRDGDVMVFRFSA